VSRTIAVVDDACEVRQALSEALEAVGFEVRQAPHALKLVSTLEVDRPAVIVLDVVNSWMDGLGLCRALKRNPEYKDIPIERALPTIHLREPYPNRNCMECHSTENSIWLRVAEHKSSLDEVRADRISCASGGCHGYAHPFDKPDVTR